MIPVSQTANLPAGAARALLDQLVRYRLLVPEAIPRLALGVPSDQSVAAAEPAKLMSPLVRARLVGVASLYLDQHYYFLAPRALRMLGNELPELPERWCGPLPETAKIVSYAILAVCVLSEHRRVRLTRRDLQQHFPELQRRGLSLNYYVDASASPPRLGFVRVDTGGRGRWDRVLARACQDWRDHEAQAGFRRFIERGQFEITVVTALPQKADRISDAISSAKQPLSVRACAVPQLLHLLVPD